ncbi:MAG: asparagine synthetase B family protein [bacterium]|nr:asparagine synthetase B family protein [bacterium]
MHQTTPIREVFDLTDPGRNLIFNMSVDEARERVGSGDPAAVREIDGQFALAARKGHIVRMARSIGRLMRTFIVKRHDGPGLIVAERIDQIRDWLIEHGYADQFHPSYTRMVPAHYLTEIALVGCPDPNPTCRRFFDPPSAVLPADPTEIGRAYVGALRDEIVKWLERIDDDAPVGVCFSGGIDSGAVFLVTYHTMLSAGLNPGRLKAFTLSVEGEGADLAQARQFLEAVDLPMFLEPIEVSAEEVDFRKAVEVIEDYKPLDIQAGAMILALCRGIRRQYPDWRYLIDGDGGDENLKDYPIEDNPELTIRSVLNNRMLYHEGWGVESIKHSLTYSGGLSRGYARTFAPLTQCGFEGFSPYTSPAVIEVAEGVPFIELTDWDHQRLYDLKGQVVARGVEAITGITMPVFEKRRFQHGAVDDRRFADRFPQRDADYREAFHAVFGP